MQMATVYTLGYEGIDVRRFIAALTGAGVQVVADVRAVPLSRKRGFSKRQLSAELAASGIDYIHFVGLGNPKNGRDAAKAGDVAEFHRIFTDHLKSTDAKASLKELARLVISRPTCLVCFEREPAECHRTLVAMELHTHGIMRVDLFADSQNQNVCTNSVLRGGHLGQGIASAE
jgi:uncharacterized protein (DUF488 family)